MSFEIPTYVFLSAVRASASMSVHVENGSLETSESFDLVLRASCDTNIVLSTGERLADVDIHLSLSTRWRTAPELDKDLTNEDVGFLSNTEGERGLPFVHGEALLLSTDVIAAMLSSGAKGKVRLALPSVPFADRRATGQVAPFEWGPGRSNMLRISSLELSVFRGDEG